MLVYLMRTAALLLLMASGCSRIQSAQIISPQDGLELRLSFSNDYSRFTVSVRNVSDHHILVLDELRPTSKVRFASGPTEVYVEDSKGSVLSNSPKLGARHWWLAGSSKQSQGAEFPGDYFDLKPNTEISGMFLTQGALLLLCGEEPFDKWKVDKVMKLRAWVFYSVDGVEVNEVIAESPWIPSVSVPRTPSPLKTRWSAMWGRWKQG